MSVEIRNSSIKLEIPGEAGEQYIIEKDKLIDPAIFGLAHRYPGVLSETIGRLGLLAKVLDGKDRRFVNHVADSLNAARVAIGNSEEV